MPDLPQKIDALLNDDIVALALAGLTAPRKTLPPLLFYDDEGCKLFERITQLPEYYLTRTEMALLPRVAADVACMTAPGAAVVEYGASNEAKAEILLTALQAPAAWVPIDVAAAALHRAAARLRHRLPTLAAYPIAADFLAQIDLPETVNGLPILGFFPGSTIGNLNLTEAHDFLRRAAVTLGSAARLLVGVDLPKDSSILIPAYDDALGVTAAFNRNVLQRLNREIGADFDPKRFAHRALWNAADSRVEMHLVSTCAQTVRIVGKEIKFSEGETIHTENSYKLSVWAFQDLARNSGWRPEQTWLDPDSLYAMHLLSAPHR